MESKSILKSVYCNYRGRVTVHDVHGQKVHELSGQLTYEKYLEIEKRSDPEITVFDGLDEYRCIACELKKKEQNNQVESILQGVGTATGSNMPVTTQVQILKPNYSVSWVKPLNPKAGEFYYDTEKHATFVYTGNESDGSGRWHLIHSDKKPINVTKHATLRTIRIQNRKSKR